MSSANVAARIMSNQLANMGTHPVRSLRSGQLGPQPPVAGRGVPDPWQRECRAGGRAELGAAGQVHGPQQPIGLAQGIVRIIPGKHRPRRRGGMPGTHRIIGLAHEQVGQPTLVLALATAGDHGLLAHPIDLAGQSVTGRRVAGRAPGQQDQHRGRLTVGVGEEGHATGTRNQSRVQPPSTDAGRISGQQGKGVHRRAPCGGCGCASGPGCALFVRHPRHLTTIWWATEAEPLCNCCQRLPAGGRGGVPDGIALCACCGLSTIVSRAICTPGFVTTARYGGHRRWLTTRRSDDPSGVSSE